MRPVSKAIVAGIITIVVYLSVVVITTPALEPIASIYAAFQLNSIVIMGMGIGVGLQIFLSEKSKLLGCRLNVKKKALGGNSGSTAMTSFFLFLLFGATWMLWLVVVCPVSSSKCGWNWFIFNTN